MHDVIAALAVGYDLLVGAIFVPIVAAIASGRGSPRAALLAISASAIAVVLLILMFGIDSIVPIYGGLTVSGGVISLDTALKRYRDSSNAH
jgi:solute:Na+ symporter, SSS family